MVRLGITLARECGWQVVCPIQFRCQKVLTRRRQRTLIDLANAVIQRQSSDCVMGMPAAYNGGVKVLLSL